MGFATIRYKCVNTTVPSSIVAQISSNSNAKRSDHDNAWTPATELLLPLFPFCTVTGFGPSPQRLRVSPPPRPTKNTASNAATTPPPRPSAPGPFCGRQAQHVRTGVSVVLLSTFLWEGSSHSQAAVVQTPGCVEQYGTIGGAQDQQDPPPSKGCACLIQVGSSQSQSCGVQTPTSEEQICPRKAIHSPCVSSSTVLASPYPESMSDTEDGVQKKSLPLPPVLLRALGF
mmetsp:Transcript_43045/g.108171  ORF Transcript_43045/g.108171 Transcript_43045/m.108171 type:complete len:229 (-) Transcript_43045:807-1493(-)